MTRSLPITALALALALLPPAAPAQADAALAADAKKPAVRGERARTRYFEGVGRSTDEQRLYQELSRSLEVYEAESREFRREVQLLIEKKYDEKRTVLAQSYERAIRDLEVLERKERLDAIAQFEEFLRRYPDDPKYSPDVMFRLAELYYERTSDDHMLAMRDYEQQLRAIDPASEAAPPREPQPDFGRSIELYRRLLSSFPAYALNDASWYLLGYCLEKQNQFDEGLAAYQQLIARHPRSRFTTEAWVRIGEHFFDAYDVANALELAAHAYEQAILDRDHPLYDKALYKLGWTYYRMDHFDEAVERFVALTDHYQHKARAAGEEEVGGDLRNEALQYTAISFADDKWGSLQRAQAFFAARGGRPYEHEIYRRMADVYFDQTRHDEAIAGYRLVLEKNPLGRDAPQIQQKIVQAYDRDRKLQDSFREAEKLATLFAEGTPWYEKHKRDPEAMAQALDLAEKSLYSTAVFHHQQAVVYKNEGKLDQALEAFQVAARSYRTYVARFPRSKNAYEIQFYLAETLYYSVQFAEAARNYEEVRDSTADNKHLEDAAFAAVLARQKHLEAETRAGAVAERKVLRSSERPEGQEVSPTALHPTEQALVAASDAWVKRFPKHERSPGIAYKAAELYFAHDDFVEARRRFEDLVRSYPSHEVAQFATNLIVESFLVTKDWASVEQVAARLSQNKDVIDPSSALYRDLVKFKLAGRFKLADELMAKGDYEGAAKKYIQLVDEEPKHEFADKALNNAAVAYENTRRFDSALRLYERIFNEYPRSSLADSALFRVAVNAENSYDFEKAVKSYQRLVGDYPASKDREAALFNAARLLEGQQRYDEAAGAFLRYADLFPNAEDAPKNQFRAALIYEKQEDWRRNIRALDEFVRKFAQKPAQVELVVDARKRIGDAHQKLGAHADARRAYAAAADEFDRRGLSPDAHPLAANAAAYARFQLAEYVFKDFEKVKIGGRGAALERSFNDKKKGVVTVNEAYAQVFKYKQLEWTLAALYRRGFALERFAQTIIETPVPPEIKRAGEDAVIVYQDMLAQQTVALEEAAVQSYEATLLEARKNRLSNEWTRRTLESLNRFRPREYPVLKEPKPAFASETVYPEGLVLDVLGQALQAPAPQRLAGGDDK
jgi:tetratricopeptide (TPR) repeat protein